MIDLTKITTPFGLLDAETQKALMKHGGPYEVYYGNYNGDGGWVERDSITFVSGSATVIRVKPEPRKPREIWVNEYSEGLSKVFHASQEIADDWASRHKDRIRTVRFIEVI